jgi:hypothetical protein
MEIKTEDYQIIYTPDTATVAFQGDIGLNGSDSYEPILQLLTAAVEQNPAVLILDLRRLELLSSSGINALSKFVIRMRDKKDIQIIVQGSPSVTWQMKSLKNLQRFLPTLELRWEQ